MLFQYAYAVAIAHRKDTTEVPITNISQVFPSNFVEPSTLKASSHLYLYNSIG